jgi:dolichyl-phosphate beta-glucosyltransferase
VEKTYLSVIIPCYDEMANLRKGVLDKVHYFLDKQKYPYEVIIVDDGSKDGSIRFIEEYIADSSHFRLIKNQHMGKAGAVTAGMLRAKGEYILFTDMDQATPIEEVKNLLPYFNETGKQGFDIVIGSRGSHREGAPFSRRIVSWGSMLLRTWIIGLGDIKDTQCGFKMFKHDVAQRLFTRVNEMHHGFKKISGSSVTAAFDMELLFLAKKMGYTIKEVPVNWLYVESRRVSPLKDSIQGVMDLLKMKQNDLRGKYMV